MPSSTTCTSSHQPRGNRLVRDEVYHPIFHEGFTRSASRLPHATVIHDSSKAFPVSGIRTGWIIDRNPECRKEYWTARSYFSITNNSSGEISAEIAMRRRDIALSRTQKIASDNLRRLAGFLAEQRKTIGWIPPRGGMPAFPWLLSGENGREFCRAAAVRGIVLAPAGCFDAPPHFRLGFAAMTDRFPDALDRPGKVINSWSGCNSKVSAF